MDHQPVKYQVLDVTDWELAGLEQLGATEHPWLREPSGEQLYLWKPASGRRLDRREHWAEKVASELAALIGVPCAVVELAEREGVVDCVSRNLQTRGYDLQPGARLLANIDPSFRPNVKGHEAYTLKNVAAVLGDVVAPDETLGSVPGGMTAFDVFAGYLAFDALLLNRDRHAGNWAVLQRRDQTASDRLCPLFDNASGLAMALSPSRKERLLNGGGVAAYVRRESLARPFARPGGVALSLHEVAAAALSLCSRAARRLWLDRIAGLSLDQVASVLAPLAGMSEVERTFTVGLVDCSRRRLTDAAAP